MDAGLVLFSIAIFIFGGVFTWVILKIIRHHKQLKRFEAFMNDLVNLGSSIPVENLPGDLQSQIMEQMGQKPKGPVDKDAGADYMG